MKEKTADIDILEELIRDYKDEKEFVGEEIIKAIETIIVENKELKEKLRNHNIDIVRDQIENLYIPKSKVEEIIKELEVEQENNRQDLKFAIDNLIFSKMDKISDKISINMSVREILQSLLEKE